MTQPTLESVRRDVKEQRMDRLGWVDRFVMILFCSVIVFFALFLSWVSGIEISTSAVKISTSTIRVQKKRTKTRQNLIAPYKSWQVDSLLIKRVGAKKKGRPWGKYKNSDEQSRFISEIFHVFNTVAVLAQPLSSNHNSKYRFFSELCLDSVLEHYGVLSRHDCPQRSEKSLSLKNKKMLVWTGNKVLSWNFLGPDISNVS